MHPLDKLREITAKNVAEGGAIYGLPRTVETEYGTVTIHPDSVAVAATGSQLQAWSRRPGMSWPCSTLARFTNVCAWFDRNGLSDLQGFDCDNEPDVYDTEDIAGDELSAWSSDVLRDVLPKDHPARFVAVDQFTV